MKIMVLEGVHPPIDGKIMARLQPLSMISIQASKSHSSKAPKSESFSHATSSSHGSATLVDTKIDEASVRQWVEVEEHDQCESLQFRCKLCSAYGCAFA